MCKFFNMWRMIRRLCITIQEQRSEIAHLEEYAANLNFIIERLERRLEEHAKIT